MTAPTPRSHDQAGFTLVELLVSMTILTIIMGATLTAFTHAMRANDAAILMLGANENLRTGLDLMVRDFTQVGQGLPTSKVIAIPSGVGATAIVRPGPPGRNYTLPLDATEITAVTPGAGLGLNMITDRGVDTGVPTDIVTIIYADSQFVDIDGNPPQCTPSADGSSMTVSIAAQIENGDLIMFTNSMPNGSAIQTVTRHSGTPPNQTAYFDAGDPLNLNQRGAEDGTIIQLQSGPGVYPATTASRIRMVTYYVDSRREPTQLVRCLNAECVVDPNGRRTVAFGMENLQLSYDLVDGVTNPADVKDPASPNLNQIRKVNIFLAVRSRHRFTVTGQCFRNSIATQVSLRSLSFVDRYR
ncbi:MAG: type II secretion system protein [Planctomycetes bacterium]|nr:type II secretion system protein [Planctomycetota bacterium]